MFSASAVGSEIHAQGFLHRARGARHAHQYQQQCARNRVLLAAEI